MSGTTISDLPNEVLLAIIDPKDNTKAADKSIQHMKNLRSVCRQWESLINEVLVQDEITIFADEATRRALPALPKGLNGDLFQVQCLKIRGEFHFGNLIQLQQRNPGGLNFLEIAHDCVSLGFYGLRDHLHYPAPSSESTTTFWQDACACIFGVELHFVRRVTGRIARRSEVDRIIYSFAHANGVAPAHSNLAARCTVDPCCTHSGPRPHTFDELRTTQRMKVDCFCMDQEHYDAILKPLFDSAQSCQSLSIEVHDNPDENHVQASAWSRELRTIWHFERVRPRQDSDAASFKNISLRDAVFPQATTEIAFAGRALEMFAHALAKSAPSLAALWLHGSDTNLQILLFSRIIDNLTSLEELTVMPHLGELDDDDRQVGSDDAQLRFCEGIERIVNEMICRPDIPSQELNLHQASIIRVRDVERLVESRSRTSNFRLQLASDAFEVPKKLTHWSWLEDRVILTAAAEHRDRGFEILAWT